MILNKWADMNLVEWTQNGERTFHILNDKNYDNFINGAADGTYCGQEDTSKVLGFTDQKHIYIDDFRMQDTFILPKLTDEQVKNFKEEHSMDWHEELDGLVRIDGEFTLEELVNMTRYYLTLKEY